MGWAHPRLQKLEDFLQLTSMTIFYWRRQEDHWEVRPNAAATIWPLETNEKKQKKEKGESQDIRWYSQAP